MSLLGTNRQETVVRPLKSSDMPGILHLIDNAWRVHLRISPAELEARLDQFSGFLAVDRVGVRGFMVIETYQPGAALIIAVGLRDTWSVEPFLDLLLPEIEQAAINRGMAALVHVGSFPWLVEALQPRGYEARAWIIVFERVGREPPPAPDRAEAVIRTAHLRDLPALAALDKLAFDRIWHKSMRNLREALARAVSFVVATIDDQIVAYEWCELFDDHAHLTRLAVHPHYQGRGVGAQLLHQAIVDTLAQGAQVITLNTQEQNLRSKTLYQRFGFVNTGERMPVLWKRLG